MLQTNIYSWNYLDKYLRIIWIIMYNIEISMTLECTVTVNILKSFYYI